ncbi:acylphosphatase [Parageobacillus thermoglucosidasius]|uniref:Acylphosphatase n=2 Tax=Caldibacillus debilis TaxID=301148 RepID=A0A150M479_9BACI|nr:acylphosphatase [Parageobacillus thermoglucosidasius]KYD19338.1 Acylphosphatase [Caldibacillus debilis]
MIGLWNAGLPNNPGKWKTVEEVDAMNARIIVSGRVQGVGFRYTVMQKALEQGINGWVRNNEDGTVEMEVEGTKEKIETFIHSLNKRLNPFIKITDMKIEYKEEEAGYKDFRIRY